MKLTQEEFIKQAINLHDNKYEYDLVNFINKDTKVEIKCSNNHIFNQSPRKHLSGQGCPFCCKNHKRTHEEFIDFIKQKHGNKYDLSKVKYINSTTKVTVACPHHGEYQIVPHSLILGNGCRKCEVDNYTTEQYIEKAKQIYGNKFNYSLTEYIDSNTDIYFKCKHGHVLKRNPSHHLSAKNTTCARCRFKHLPKNFLHFKILAHKKHNYQYDYSLSKYINNSIQVDIICPLHGVFSQQPRRHINGSGCPKCTFDRFKDEKHFLSFLPKKLLQIYDFSQCNFRDYRHPISIICKKHGIFTKFINSLYKSKCLCPKCSIEFIRKRNEEFFIEKCKQIHYDKNFDYSKINYVNASTKIIIGCSSHGDFLIKPCKLLVGQGCKHCKLSYAENFIREWLDNHDINYITQKTFEGCCDKRPLRFDFCITSLGNLVCIEYDGITHSRPCFGEKHFKEGQRRDKIKNKFCKKNNIHLIRISGIENIEPTLTHLIYPIII